MCFLEVSSKWWYTVSADWAADFIGKVSTYQSVIDAAPLDSICSGSAY